ncbi:hypothetical protein HMPREF3038_00728 [Akkermansia sp. KLE1797]|nr:hypothetical protein HMPREF3038_00728 [Akkermansia sp. KLE1797]KXU54187.1 hypothetical protein HMPREF3039_01514 [Akkermansia sp. KLE1798]KZA04717.1 hypothetical protein HMPREF1326_01592 [Akkermansia sp. KLE1605]
MRTAPGRAGKKESSSAEEGVAFSSPGTRCQEAGNGGKRAVFSVTVRRKVLMKPGAIE